MATPDWHWSKQPNAKEILEKIKKSQKQSIANLTDEERSERFGHWQGMTGELSANWKGGRRMNDQGYILIHNPEHPNSDKDGCVREHRLVIEESLGRYLEPEERVHHLNGKRNDNRLENLELVSDQTEHMKLYHTGHLKEFHFKKGYTPWNYGNTRTLETK